MITKPKIINQHEYMSINFGNNRRLTGSYSGIRAAGAIPSHVFDAFCKAVEDKDYATTYGERVQKFADNIGTLWPQWNKPPRSFAVNENVTYDMGKRRGGFDKGVVTKVRGTSVTVKWERSGLIGMTADMLEQYNPTPK